MFLWPIGGGRAGNLKPRGRLVLPSGVHLGEQMIRRFDLSTRKIQIPFMAIDELKRLVRYEYERHGNVDPMS